jgi:hypothetical protein
LASAPLPKGQSVGNAPVRGSVVRISIALGEVKLNINKATHGLAHGSGAPGNLRSTASKDSTSIWSDSKAGSTSSVALVSSNGGSGGTGGGASSSSGSAATSAAGSTAAASNSGNGNAATGNGNGNGNGNGGEGNGKGKGNAKH